MKYLVDLIKSGSYIDIFYAKTCATIKISTVAGYHVVLATLLSPNITPLKHAEQDQTDRKWLEKS